MVASMRTAMALRQQSSLPHSKLSSKMDTAADKAVNLYPYGPQGGMLGQIRPDGTGKTVGTRNPRRAVEDRSLDARRSANTRMVVEQAVIWSWGELEGMEEVVGMVRGRLKVSERFLAAMGYIGFFVPPIAMIFIHLMASIRLQLRREEKK